MNISPSEWLKKGCVLKGHANICLRVWLSCMCTTQQWWLIKQHLQIVIATYNPQVYPIKVLV